MEDPKFALKGPNNNPDREPQFNDLVEFLASLIAYIGTLLAQLGGHALNLVLFLSRKWKLIAIGAVTGLVLVATYQVITPSYYRSSMMVRSAYFEEELMKKAVQDLNDACAGGAFDHLAHVFDANPERVASLKSFRLEIEVDTAKSSPVVGSDLSQATADAVASTLDWEKQTNEPAKEKTGFEGIDVDDADAIFGGKTK